MGAKFAFVQSDEISILITDFDNLQTEAWFGNNVQKCVSVSASMATRAFNEARLNRLGSLERWGEFDSRIFQIPSKPEVANYFIWRQQDTTRNSIESVARSLYSHKELDRKNTSEQQEMIFSKGQNWNDYPVKLKRGRLIVKNEYEHEGAKRTRWESIEPPIFTADQEYLYGIIPDNN
jgi:tRNA(His) 5'-end guanylyltransferase